jgi:hypothetical protein
VFACAWPFSPISQFGHVAKMISHVHIFEQRSIFLQIAGQIFLFFRVFSSFFTLIHPAQKPCPDFPKVLFKALFTDDKFPPPGWSPKDINIKK